MLVTLGQFLVWPTIATAILWPLLAVLYYRQAKREEAKLFEKFGERFREDASKTPMFFPKIPLRSRHKPVSTQTKSDGLADVDDSTFEGPFLELVEAVVDFVALASLR